MQNSPISSAEAKKKLRSWIRANGDLPSNFKNSSGSEGDEGGVEARTELAKQLISTFYRNEKFEEFTEAVDAVLKADNKGGNAGLCSVVREALYGIKYLDSALDSQLVSA